MIYKFISYHGIDPKIGYIKEIPSDAIFYKAFSNDKYENWYIAIRKEEFENPLRIEWQGRYSNYIDVIKLNKWVFLYVSAVKTENWPDVGKTTWDLLFHDFFNSIYFYETQTDEFIVDFYSDLISSLYSSPLTNYVGIDYTRQDKIDLIKEHYKDESKIVRWYKMKGLTDNGCIKVIKVWKRNEECYGMEHTSIDGTWENRSNKSYEDRNNLMDISTDGTEFWNMFNECVNNLSN